MARRFLVSVFVSDLVALIAALLASAWLVFGAGAATIPEGSTLWPFAVLMVTGAAIGSWANGRAWANSAPRPTYGRAFAIVAFASTFTAVGLVLTRAYWSRPMFALTIVIWFALAAVHRAARRRRPWAEKMVVISAEKQLVEDLRESSHANVVVAWEPTEQPLFDLVGDDVSIVVDLRSALSDPMARFVSSASVAGFGVRTFSNVYEEHTGRIPMVHLAEGWELTQPVARSRYAPIKRAFDFGLTLVTAPVWLVLSGLVWAAVKLESRGSALYHQERIGRDGTSFTLHKFRTMNHGAEPNGPQFASPNDPRITRVGRILRKSRLDELPQLWNVIKGDLSIIGPRPERPVFVEKFESEIPFYSSRHLIRPGITGWAQVNYGYADDLVDAVEKLTYDLYYVKNSSPWLDLHIMGKTVWTMITGSGAR